MNNFPNFNNLSIEYQLQTVMTKEYVQILMENVSNKTEQTIGLIMIC